MIDYSKGQIVISKAGRDKGKMLVILNVIGEKAFLADGKNRKTEQPKTKKKKHIQTVNYIDIDIANKLQNNEKVSNIDIRKALEKYAQIVQN